MPPSIRFDQGDTGVVNRSRNVTISVSVDIVAVAGTVSGTAAFDILAKPSASTAVLTGVNPLDRQLVPDVAGTWRIRVMDSADGSRVIHTLTVPTVLRGLAHIAHNERADPNANLVDVVSGDVDAGETNTGGVNTGYAPNLEKTTTAVELNADLALGARETGWLSGGLITVNVDPAKYDIAAGTVRVQGVILPVPFGPFTAVSPLNLATTEFTANGINSSGALVQSDDQTATVAGATFRRNNAVLQLVIHTDNATVTNIDGSRQTSEHLQQELLDLLIFTGPRNQGNVYSPASTDLTLKKSVGLTASHGLAAIATPLAPAYQDNPAIDPGPVFFLLIHRDGLGGFAISVTTVVPAGFWDNDDTSLSATPKYVDHQMHFFNNINVCVPGQNTYDTEAEALAAVTTETTVLQTDVAAVPNTYRMAIVAAAITDLNNAAFFTPPEGT